MLRRAIGNTAAIELIVVVNGQSCDAAFLAELTARPDIAVYRLAQASSPAAILAGRRAVGSPALSYLDDDYLPGAVDARLRALVDNPGADIVASNGLRRLEGRDTLALKNLANVNADPLAALFVENWLPSCGATFRTATVPATAFENLPRHIHWSLLGYTLAVSGKKVVVLELPTFVINDTPGSSSKLENYLPCHIEIYLRMSAVAPPERVRAIVARRLGSAIARGMRSLRAQGRLRDAWLAHLRSVGCPGGLMFLSYTRHLLVPERRLVKL